jgi:hypothetical protein
LEEKNKNKKAQQKQNDQQKKKPNYVEHVQRARRVV